MTYRTEFKDIIYPNEHREARVAQYRLLLVERDSKVSVIVHLRRDPPTKPFMFERDRDFDVVVGRIIDLELRGVRVDQTRLVVEAESTFTVYPLNFNAADFPARASAEAPWKRPVVELESRDIVGGSVALFVDVDAGEPAEHSLGELLRG